MKFPSGKSPRLSALGADNLHQRVILLVSKHVSSNHLVGLVIMQEEGRVQDSEGLLEVFLNS